MPFKLITEYVEVLGGVESDMFKLFRKLFFKYILSKKKTFLKFEYFLEEF